MPYSDDDGNFDLGWTLVMVAFGLVALAASLYLVVVLEILKFRRFRERQLRRGGRPALEAEIDDEIEREVETGEFDAVARRRPLRTESPAPARISSSRAGGSAARGRADRSAGARAIRRRLPAGPARAIRSRSARGA